MTQENYLQTAERYLSKTDFLSYFKLAVFCWGIAVTIICCVVWKLYIPFDNQFDYKYCMIIIGISIFSFILIFCIGFMIKKAQIKSKNDAQKNRELGIKGQAEIQKEISQNIANDPNEQTRKNIVKKMLDQNINHKNYPTLIILVDALFGDTDFKNKLVNQFPKYDENCEEEFQSELIRYIINPITETIKLGTIDFPKINSHNSIFKMLYLIPYALNNLKEKKYHDILDLKGNESKIFNQYIEHALNSLEKAN